MFHVRPACSVRYLQKVDSVRVMEHATAMGQEQKKKEESQAKLN